MQRFRHRLSRAGLGAVVGLLAAGSAIGVGELVAALFRPAASPVIAVGNKFILLTPESLKDFAIRNFGSDDKTVLLTGIYVAIAVLAVVLGMVALRWRWVGVLGLLLFGAVGVWSAATANASQGSDAVPTVIGTLVAVGVLLALLRRLPQPAPSGTDTVAPAHVGAARRQFLLGAGAVAVAAAVAGFAGRILQHTRFNASASRAAVRLPEPTTPAPALPNGVDLGKSATPFVTPNGGFYRVDTALTVPQVATDTYSLQIHGMVEHDLQFSYDELLARPLIERYLTMTCVSNPVGGPYIGTAKFLGVHLADLLREAGVRPGADQIVGTSVDGMTIGTPTAVIMDGRDAMLAVGMNGQPLPLEHGFPVRMVVPGLYGYVSATKWLVDLNATTFAAFDSYWVQRGWAQQGPIRLESRIDTPQGFAHLTRGAHVPIAGVAWQQHVGIEGVQVRIDGGPWQDARLGRVPSTDTWVQWVYPWTVAGSGPVTLEVRAIDATGQVQTGQNRDPFPSGASGYHSVVVQVS